MSDSQCWVNRAGDQRPLARLSAVWPPADMPYMLTLSSASSGRKRGSLPSASTVRDTSTGRSFQLSGPGVPGSL